MMFKCKAQLLICLDGLRGRHRPWRDKGDKNARVAPTSQADPWLALRPRPFGTPHPGIAWSGPFATLTVE